MRSIVFVVVGVLLLGGLFVAFRPDGALSLPSVLTPPAAAPVPVPRSAAMGTTSPSTDNAAPRTFGEPFSYTFDLVVTRGRLTSGPSTLALTQGDLVVLRVRSDRDDELHLHGYDLSVALFANQTGSLAFQADRTGRFDIELHHGGTEIGALEVRPR